MFNIMFKTIHWVERQIGGLPSAGSYYWPAGFQVWCPCAGSQQSAGTSNLSKKTTLLLIFPAFSNHRIYSWVLQVLYYYSRIWSWVLPGGHQIVLCTLMNQDILSFVLSDYMLTGCTIGHHFLYVKKIYHANFMHLFFRHVRKILL